MAAIRKEVLYLKGKLESDVSEEKAYHILKKLKSIPMTVDLLIETGIGKTIRSYRKRPGEVGKCCKGLIAKWKDLVMSATDNDVESYEAQRNANTSRTLTVERENSYTVYDDSKDAKGSSSKPVSVLEKTHSSEKLLPNNKSVSKNESRSSKAAKPDSQKRKHSSLEDSVDLEVKRLHSSPVHTKKHVNESATNGKKHKDSFSDKSKSKEIKHEKTAAKSVSSKNTNKEKSTDKKKAKILQKKIISATSSDGFTSSVASFEDCLSLSDVKKKVAPKKKVVSSQNHSPHKSRSTPSPKINSDESYTSTRLPSSSEYSGQKLYNTDLKPLPDLNLDLISTLPMTQPTYKPMRYAMPDSPPRRKKSGLQEIDTSLFMSSKHNRTQVFSGRKVHGSLEIPTLYEMCIRVLQDNIDDIEYTGGVPYDRLKPILERCTPQQLYQIEDFNPYLIEDTEELWKSHCHHAFKGRNPDECETWREFYLKMFDEREAKLKSITANISASMAKALPVRQTKLAYVDTVAKPPRNIARQQAKYGTGIPLIIPPQDKTKSPKIKPIKAPPPPPVEIVQPTKIIKKVPPLMQKTLKLMKSRFRR